MAIVYKSRVWEQTPVTGTGAVTLSSTSPTGYQSFASAFTTGSEVAYVIVDPTTGAWETGVGTYTTGSLSRGVRESSNANALVSFAGNSCNVYVDIIAPKAAGGTTSQAGSPVALNDQGYVDPSMIYSQLVLGTTAPSNTNYLWWNTAHSSLNLYNGSAWVGVTPYDIAVGLAGPVTASQVMARYVIARHVTLPASFTGSSFSAGTAPTAAATFTVAVNGTSVGTINFAAAATTATFTAASAVTITPGQILTVTAPATADTTLANVSGTLVGTFS